MGRAWTSGDRNARTTEIVTASDYVAFVGFLSDVIGGGGERVVGGVLPRINVGKRGLCASL